MLVEIREKHPWTGRVLFVVREHHRACRYVRDSRSSCTCWAAVSERTELENMIVTDGKNLARDMLMGAVGDAKVRYFGLGTSATAPALTQHQLVAETFRKGLTTYVAGAAGEAINTVFVAPAEAVFAIQEVGFFAGALATAVANSGVMIARVLYAHTKTALESIQIDRHDQF